jgi:hypothetical protein
MTQLSSSLQDSDPAIYDIIEREKNRQVRCAQPTTALSICRAYADIPALLYSIPAPELL